MQMLDYKMLPFRILPSPTFAPFSNILIDTPPNFWRLQSIDRTTPFRYQLDLHGHQAVLPDSPPTFVLASPTK
jgi:hypothetical protein